MTQPLSFHLSLRLREALKAGLAMAVTCGVSLSLGWDNPSWACIAVAVVSMPTIGESINRSFHRLLGTVMGGLVALMIAVLFPQDRWLFLLCLSLWVAFSAYRMTVSRYLYVWFIAGYVGTLIAAYIGSGPQGLFNVFTARIQETALGIIVYAVISTLIWPQKSSDELNRLLVDLLNTQKTLFNRYFDLMSGHGGEETEASLYATETQLVARLAQRLQAAEIEQFEVYETRHRWRQTLGLCQELMEVLELWRESLSELRGVDAAALFSNLDDYRADLLRRLDLAGLSREGNGDAIPPETGLNADTERLAELPHHARAVVHNVQLLMERLERVSHSLATGVRRISADSGPTPEPANAGGHAAARLPDEDSLMAVFHALLAFWMGAFFWIYVDVPGHMMFVVFVSVFAVLALMGQQVDWVKLFAAEAWGALLGGLLYVFVMPHLSGYFGLGTLLFVFTSSLYYVFWHPRMTMLKMASIMPFLLLTGIQNKPSYDFAVFANNATGMLLSIVFTAFAFNFPYSQRPEKMFMRVTRRYFHQAGQFLERFVRQPPPRERQPALRASLARMQTSAGKIGGWGRSIDYKLMPCNPPERTSALVGCLNSITYRFRMLADAGRQTLPMGDACRAQALAWEAAIGGALEPWTMGRFEVADVPALRTRLASLEAGLENVLSTFPVEDGEEAYAGTSRLLGCYRALYRALITYAETADGIDWNHWRESRF
ncbi:p-hydroxybenzoic acid efflux pump subunit AaeB [Pseudodesulfovibrio hydrargyri]|uniref:p-hydroxybenzoic acid efflux pump subunit AaeB n=1 Tax=Pseudodesulfovibrio hydrargyri TaxID=2125990 RepID=A0A1J5MWY3_9BACT|nr:FUSC family protein [Pseudodesulfovibrio hydrargyri]OIQ50324.1 p-hydroxybenzoic acid efflux pump subunit AaeB [Pseudodesulfovibrio hydrargyri]